MALWNATKETRFPVLTHNPIYDIVLLDARSAITRMGDQAGTTRDEPLEVSMAKWPHANSPSRQRRRHKGSGPCFAAIDLGTHNCRMLIARPSNEGPVVIDGFSRIVRLGEGLAKSGNLCDHAIDRTISALRVCANKIKRHNVVPVSYTHLTLPTKA